MKPHKIGIGWAHSGEGETGKVIPGLGISERDFGEKLVLELGREIFNAGMVFALGIGPVDERVSQINAPEMAVDCAVECHFDNQPGRSHSIVFYKAASRDSGRLALKVAAALEEVAPDKWTVNVPVIVHASGTGGYKRMAFVEDTLKPAVLVELFNSKSSTVYEFLKDGLDSPPAKGFIASLARALATGLKNYYADDNG